MSLKRLLVFPLLLIYLIVLTSCVNSKPNNLVVNFYQKVVIGFNGKIDVTSPYQNDKITFLSSDDAILTVDELGNVLALKDGLVTIYISSPMNRQVKHTVQVLKKEEVKEIKLFLNEEGPYQTGKKYHLNIELEPFDLPPIFRFNFQTEKIAFNEETKELIFLEAGPFNFTCYYQDNLDVFANLKLDVDYSNELEQYHLLFIGNSLTKHTYDIPSMIKGMIETNDINVTVKVDSTSPQWIIDHKSSFLQLIKVNKYTHVILQEYSRGPIIDFDKFENAVIEFDSLIKENKAKTILYQTWPYHLSYFNGNLVLQEQMKNELEDAYQRVASKINATVVKAGSAFYHCLTNHYNLELYQDVNHPSLFGAYLSACVHYATITNRRSFGNPFEIDGISTEVKKILQEVADLIVFG